MGWGRSCGPGICVSRLAPWGWFGPSGGVFLLALPERCLFVDSLSGFFCFLCFLVCSLLPCGRLLVLVGDVYLFFVTFPCGILGHMWYLIVSFSEHCFLSNC